jgi:hypothetical protein
LDIFWKGFVMLIKRVLMAAAFVLATQAVGWAAPTVFDFGGNLDATSGSGTLTYANDTASAVAFGTASSFGLPSLQGDPTVMKIVTGLTETQGLLFDSGDVANGGGAKINNYTMVYNLLVPNITPPSSSTQTWFTFYNTDPTNGDDGELFLRGKIDSASVLTRGIGVSGRYQGDVADNAWYQVALTVSNTGTVGTADALTTMTKYITDASGVTQTHVLNLYGPGAAVPADVGNVMGRNDTSAGVDERWAISATGTADRTWIFGDNDGDTEPAYIRSFYFNDRVMSAGELGVPEPSALTLLVVAGLSALGYWWRKR